METDGSNSATFKTAACLCTTFGDKKKQITHTDCSGHYSLIIYSLQPGTAPLIENAEI